MIRLYNNSDYRIYTAATVTFSQLSYTAREDIGFIQLELFLSNPSSTNTTVELISTDGSATGNYKYFKYVLVHYYCIGDIDYDTGPYVFTIFTGMTSIAVNITIFNDNILEENEMFYLTINSSSLPNDITAGNPFQATVAIENDDCK